MHGGLARVTSPPSSRWCGQNTLVWCVPECVLEDPHHHRTAASISSRTDVVPPSGSAAPAVGRGPRDGWPAWGQRLSSTFASPDKSMVKGASQVRLALLLSAGTVYPLAILRKKMKLSSSSARSLWSKPLKSPVVNHPAREKSSSRFKFYSGLKIFKRVPSSVRRLA